ncbi:MAG: hypothetical protein NVSMB23_16980 [Myxococcales bacterium]
MAIAFRRTGTALRAAAALIAVAGAGGCATAGAPPRQTVILSSAPAPLPDRTERPREEAAGSLGMVLAAARASLGKPTKDCSGFVESMYRRAGVDLLAEARPGDGGVRALARYVHKHGRWHTRKVPAPGDLVFFHNSYDRDENGKLDDLFTHVGIVDEVGADGTAQIIHSTNHGIVREPMNLLRPHAPRDSAGHPINAVLRRKRAHEPRHTPHLMSELFAGFGTVVQPRIASLRCARPGCDFRS